MLDMQQRNVAWNEDILQQRSDPDLILSIRPTLSDRGSGTWRDKWWDRVRYTADGGLDIRKNKVIFL